VERDRNKRETKLDHSHTASLAHLLMLVLSSLHMVHSEETVCSLSILQTHKSEKHSQRKTEYGSSSTSSIHKQFAKKTSRKKNK